MCEQHGIDRNAGLTEAEFRDLIFDDLDPTDRDEMQQLFKMYEHVVLAAQRAHIPEDAAACRPPTLPAAVSTLPTQEPAPVAPVHPQVPGEVRATFDQPGQIGIGLRLNARSVLELPQVDEVDPGSPAAHAGVRPGFWLCSVNGTSVSGISDDAVIELLQARPCTLIFVDPDVPPQDVPPQPLGAPPTRAPSHPGQSVRLAPWRTRDQFTDDDQYGAYIQATLRAGMRVRARCHAEHVIETGDEGVYLQTNGGEPPCQVRWDGYGGTFWVQWYHVEIISPADAAGQDGGAGARLEDPMVQQLARFGFDATQAAAALERVGGDLNGAIDLLSAGM